MEILAILILAGMAFGVFRIIGGLFKELLEMTIEAWHSGDAEPQ